MPDLGSDIADLGSERPDLGPDLESDMPGLGSARADKDWETLFNSGGLI